LASQPGFGDAAFARVIEIFHAGEPDPVTLAIVAAGRSPATGE
jgi:hypothetical protein